MFKKLVRYLHRIEGRQKSYVSEAGLFLQEFDQQHPDQSKSQILEIKKHARIFAKRDGRRV